MGLKDWLTGGSELKRALQRGLQPGGKLSDEVSKLQVRSGRPFARRELEIKSRADADAICATLERIRNDPSAGGDHALQTLVGLFQDVVSANCPAFQVLREQGVAHLVAIVDHVLAGPAPWSEDDALFALKIAAMYGSAAGTDAVIRAARRPLKSDAYMWHPILSAYSREHPEHRRLFRALSDPIPPDFLAIALIDAANGAQFEQAEFKHPFDSPAGVQRLETWLTGDDPEKLSYAISTARALPFIHPLYRDRLLTLALDHAGIEVQIDAARIAAKLGREAGITCLSRYCLDIAHSERARHYLTELGREDAIPAAAREPEFQVKAEFAQWLAHPSELGRPPDELRIVDHRELAWPPERKKKQFWLIEYRVRDDTGLKDDDVGVGLVGSVTFCFFSFQLHQRPPEDTYAIHCIWELTQQELIEELEVEPGSTEYAHTLGQWTGDPIDDVTITRVLVPSTRLGYPQRIIALGKGRRAGVDGGLVLDGPRSRWYPASDFPESQIGSTVLNMHVGRELLGFRAEPDRRRFIQIPVAARSPEQIIAAYEKLLEQARRDPLSREKLLENSSILSTSFSDYAHALASARGLSAPAGVAIAYEQLRATVATAEQTDAAKLFDSFTPLGANLDAYGQALIALRRQSEVPKLVEFVTPHWDHNLGYGILGALLHRAGHFDAAEPFLTKLRNSLEEWWRNPEMALLAEIWWNSGRRDQARALLREALQTTQEKSGDVSICTRRQFDEAFQVLRSKFVALMGSAAESELGCAGIKQSLIQ